MRIILYLFFVGVLGVVGLTHSLALGVTCAVGGWLFAKYILWAYEVAGGDNDGWSPSGWWDGDTGSGTIFDFGGFDGGGDGGGGGD